MSVRIQRSGNFVVISPARDEVQYIERNLASMIGQTVRPLKWVIVDDGSRDGTVEIVERYAQRVDWIVPLRLRSNAEREPGLAVIRAFNAGYELIRDDGGDFLVKLDTDVELPPDYFERMLTEFDKNPALGIASGVYLEMSNGDWSPVKMPEYHAAGASKMIRRACYQEIGGFATLPGWDTADEIKALARGWHTAHFPDIQFHHLRPEGSATGLMKTHVRHGHTYYACGGGRLFFFLKCLHRMVFGKPFFTGAAALLYGYMRAAVTRPPKLVSDTEARAYRKMLNARLTGRFNRILHPSKAS
jgi:poly-beta-1,6-N-acetyl-D-glucosamine synthase